MKYQRILFVCTGNTCRSALAELMFKKKLADAHVEGVQVQSAGVGAQEGMTSPPEILGILKKQGIDGSSHCSQPLTPELVDWADLILAMEVNHQMLVASRYPRTVGRIYVLKSFVKAGGDSDIEDPIGRPLKVYEARAQEIRSALDKLLEKLKEKPPEES